MSIYVETLIHGSIDELWQKTQTPELHQRWDLRFTDIQYLPRPDDNQPQQFRYATRIGFGLQISGCGETMGRREDGGRRASSLKFWSDDPKSLIKVGSGYWKYIQTENGIQFFTWYTYQTRYGMPGKLFNAFIFEPLMSWATAWSFDRLRLWIEKSISPELSMCNSLIHGLARLTLALIWLYQGFVPKLLFHHRDEVAMMLQTGIVPGSVQTLVSLLGLAEVIFGLLMLVLWRRWLFLVNIGLMIVATVGVALSSSQYLAAAFNPVTLNLALIGLALIGYLASADIPLAGRCLRRRQEQ